MSTMSSLMSLVATTLLAASAVTASFPDCRNGPAILRQNAVCDTSLSPAIRAVAIVKAMTLEEKFNITGDTSPGVPRLGLPAYEWWSEALHGVAQSPGANFSDSGDFSFATSFPQPITMGAAFDDALIEAAATIISTEARAFNNVNRFGLDVWTPNINGYKDPRWGRGAETPGEDPFHLSSYLKHLILGLQGGHEPSTKKLVATCKHYAAYDLELWHGVERHRFDAKVSTQDLVEYYLPMFQQCARDSKVGSIMCSYNELNGVPTCADPYLLQTVLREHWGWNQTEHYITSDCGAIADITTPWHNYTKTPEEAVAVALHAGVDTDCGDFYQGYLSSAYDQGLFDVSALDQALTRQYAALVRLGYFDPPSSTPYRSLNWSSVSTLEAESLAYQAAIEGVVLLKNDGLLPLTLGNGSSVSSIAVIGDWFNATTQMQGNYYGNAPYLRSPLYAAQQLGQKIGIKVEYASGPSQLDTNDQWPLALDAASKSDVVLFVSGVDIKVEKEGKDRENITWVPAQLSLLNQISSMGKPVIVVQMGNQLDNTPLLEDARINALLWGGYPGQSGGPAILDIITGTAAPAGRLPVTQYPGDYVNQVPMIDMSLRPSTSNPGRTYKWYNDSVLPFGHGLHYTNFSVDLSSGTAKSIDIQTFKGRFANATYSDLAPFTTVSVNVKNNGKVVSDYVALLFIAGTYGPEPYPLKQLAGYTRIKDIQPGSAQTAEIPLTLGSLSRVDEEGNKIIYSGSYKLLLDVPTRTTLDFELTGDNLLLIKWPENPQQAAL